MTRSIAIAIILVAIVMLAGMAMTPASLVRVIGADGKHIVCERITASSTIALTFTHSMYGGDVIEVYALGANSSMNRTSILTDNAAAAEYYAWDGAVREIDGRYEVVAPDQEFASLAVRVDDIGNHRLTVDDVTFDLAAMVDGSSRVWMSITARPLIAQVFGTRC